MIFISHDLGVVRYIADNIAVMYQGKIVEYGEAESVFHHPQHDYTKRLLASIPKLPAA
jgi:ABC-type dipeptide/oligopeptide/nickel transport system ATPase component